MSHAISFVNRTGSSTDRDLRDLKIAVVHDWLITYGGAERVLEQILKVVPHADLFSLFDFVEPRRRAYIRHKRVTTSFLQKFPFARKKYRSYLPLMPMAVEQFDLSSYDLVISSSHAVAHGVLTDSEQLHLSYINNTMVYAWDMYHHYLRTAGLHRGPSGLVARAVMHYIRTWDAASAHRVDRYVANSHYMARRLKKLYGRDSRVVYPPVEVDKFDLHRDKDDYYVVVSRLVPFKRVDLMVDAFSRMPDKKLIVIGDGPDMGRLAASAADNVSFVGFLGRPDVNDYIKRARAFLFSSVEPFGIAVVEALACGTPVIALGKGAATEIVTEDETGLFFNRQTAEAIIDAVHKFESVHRHFDPGHLRRTAERFSTDRFRAEFTSVVKKAMEDHRMRHVTPPGSPGDNFQRRIEPSRLSEPARAPEELRV